MKQYTIVVDLQNDFINGPLGTPQAQAIVENVARCAKEARAEGRTVLFTQDTHEPNYLSTNEGRHLPVEHCIKGTTGWQIYPAIAPYVNDPPIEKPTFGSVELVKMLRQDSQEDAGADLDLVLCGVCTDICVVSNALLLRAHFPEASIRLYADGCAGSSPQRHEAAIDVMRSCQIDVM